MKPLLPLLALLAACAAPEVAQDIAAGRALLTAIRTDTGPALTTAANAEFRAAEDARIRAGLPVLRVEGECDPLDDPAVTSLLSTCRVISAVPPPAGVNARTTAEFLAILDTYVSALEMLASEASVEEVRTQAAALVDAFGKPDATRPAAFESIAAHVRTRRALIVEASGFVLDRVRLMALRRAIRAAAPDIAEGIAFASETLAEIDPALRRAQNNHQAALDEVAQASASGDAARYRRAVDILRALTQELAQEQARSPVIRLRAFGATHENLVRATRFPGSAARIVGFLEQLRRLRDAVVEETP